VNIASREHRLVPFSWLYHGMTRDLVVGVEQELNALRAGHDYHHRVASVSMHAAFVTETAINEIAYWLGTHLTQRVAMPPGFERFPIRRKWRTVPKVCRAARFNEAIPPWEDFNALVELRNALAHAGAYPAPPEPVLQLLEARGCAQPASDWFESVMTLRTARWAHRTAAAMPLALKGLLAPHVDLHNGGFSWVWDKAWLP
jgi:hypothetical protein